jgi:hypothetical protein
MFSIGFNLMGHRHPRAKHSPPSWNPAALSPLAWYDVSDVSTLFQDTEQTVPVTTDGDPVGMVLDQSGNGYHISQSIMAARPTYRTDGISHWIEFDGTTQTLEQSNLSVPTTFSFVMAATVETQKSNFSVLISMDSAADFQIDAGSKNSGFNFRFNGTALSPLRLQSSTGFDGAFHVYCITLDAESGTLSGRVDGTTEYSNTSYNGAISTMQHLRLFSNRDNSQKIGGRLYSLTLLPTVEVTDLTRVETWALQHSA